MGREGSALRVWIAGEGEWVSGWVMLYLVRDALRGKREAGEEGKEGEGRLP